MQESFLRHTRNRQTKGRKPSSEASAGELIASDERGKHRSRPHAISDELKKQVREHIELFPRRKSHYSRADNKKREYLDEGLSISRMYLLYLEKYEPQIKTTGAKPQVKEWLYRKIFTEEYNLGFGYPRSDTCETCDLLQVTIKAAQSEAEREESQQELAAHQEKASQGYSALRAAKEATGSCVNHTLITFDLMQNLPVPTLTHSSMFYSRQLWAYNLGIYRYSSVVDDATMCMWNEAIAGRGADEICSCLRHYLGTLPPETTKLTASQIVVLAKTRTFRWFAFGMNRLQSAFNRLTTNSLLEATPTCQTTETLHTLRNARMVHRSMSLQTGR